jgi:hypothetical protein
MKIKAVNYILYSLFIHVDYFRKKSFFYFENNLTRQE